jgi:hypothetical protein
MRTNQEKMDANMIIMQDKLRHQQGKDRRWPR